jgi:hypothetical protein
MEIASIGTGFLIRYRSLYEPSHLTLPYSKGPHLCIFGSASKDKDIARKPYLKNDKATREDTKRNEKMALEL